jgi:hypothetical protein
MRQTMKIAVTLVVVAALAMTGIALAQTSDSPVADAAPDGSRLEASILERLAPLVEDGTISEDQAEAVATHLAETASDRPHRRPGFKAIGEALEFLGVTPEEARAALSEGQTLAELAEANGSSADELIDFLIAQLEAHLDEAVANDRITEAEQAEILESAEERITALVNGDIEPHRPHDRRGPHRPGPRFNPSDHAPESDGA